MVAVPGGAAKCKIKPVPVGTNRRAKILSHYIRCMLRHYPTKERGQCSGERKEFRTREQPHAWQLKWGVTLWQERSKRYHVAKCIPNSPLPVSKKTKSFLFKDLSSPPLCIVLLTQSIFFSKAFRPLRLPMIQ